MLNSSDQVDSDWIHFSNTAHSCIDILVFFSERVLKFFGGRNLPGQRQIPCLSCCGSDVCGCHPSPWITCDFDWCKQLTGPEGPTHALFYFLSDLQSSCHRGFFFFLLYLAPVQHPLCTSLLYFKLYGYNKHMLLCRCLCKSG